MREFFEMLENVAIRGSFPCFSSINLTNYCSGAQRVIKVPVEEVEIDFIGIFGGKLLALITL